MASLVVLCVAGTIIGLYQRYTLTCLTTIYFVTKVLLLSNLFNIISP